jgi:hypothetical protein
MEAKLMITQQRNTHSRATNCCSHCRLFIYSSISLRLSKQASKGDTVLTSRIPFNKLIQANTILIRYSPAPVTRDNSVISGAARDAASRRSCRQGHSC